MKRQIQRIVLLIIIIFLCTSGLFSGLTDFFTWLVTLHYSASEVSAYGEIFVKILSFVISYSIVGLIFDLIGLYDKKLMSLSYYIVSTISSFALCYVVMIFETYLLVIFITFIIIFVVIIIIYIIRMCINRN